MNDIFCELLALRSQSQALIKSIIICNCDNCIEFMKQNALTMNALRATGVTCIFHRCEYLGLNQWAKLPWVLCLFWWKHVNRWWCQSKQECRNFIRLGLCWTLYFTCLHSYHQHIM